MSTFLIASRLVKAPEQRGAFGAWLVQQRQRLGEQRGQKVRQTDLADEIRAAGYPIRDDYYRALEGGSKTPGRETREALGRFFGSQPPMTDEPKAELGDLIEAIRSQTDAINRLVERLPAGPDTEALAEQLGEALAIHLAPLLAGRGELQSTGSQ